MKLTGQILDVENNAPVPQVSIGVLDANGKPTGIGTVTGANGEYTIDSTKLDSPNAKLSITHISYSPTTIRVTDVGKELFIAKTGQLLSAVTVFAKNKPGNLVIVIAIAALLITALYITLKNRR